MVSITMDHSAMIFYHRHPAIERLRELEQEGKLRLFHSQNLSRELASLNKTEEKIYDRLRQMVFQRRQQDLNLAEHGDLVLLVNHMKSGRDYFLTLDQKRYESLRGHRSLDIRFPDKAFMKEIESRLGIVTESAKKREKAKKAAKTGKPSKPSKARGKSRKK
jgi:hypothetical protein